MAGRMYTIDLPPTAITVAADLIEITPADDKPIRIISLSLGQTTDFGDAQEEIISIFWIRGHTTSGTGGAAATPRPNQHTDAAFGGTAEVFNTGAASVGTTVNLNRHAWNVRAPMERPYTPDEQPEASQTNTTLVLRMAAAPADSVTISGTCVVEELG